jgi:hypothetical protein
VFGPAGIPRKRRLAANGGVITVQRCWKKLFKEHFEPLARGRQRFTIIDTKLLTENNRGHSIDG